MHKEIKIDFNAIEMNEPCNCYIYRVLMYTIYSSNPKENEFKNRFLLTLD